MAVWNQNGGMEYWNDLKNLGGVMSYSTTLESFTFAFCTIATKAVWKNGFSTAASQGARMAERKVEGGGGGGGMQAGYCRLQAKIRACIVYVERSIKSEVHHGLTSCSRS